MAEPDTEYLSTGRRNWFWNHWPFLPILHICQPVFTEADYTYQFFQPQSTFGWLE
jgi:hypothetical protein